MKILFRSHSIEKNIARNANAVPCCSLLKDDNERWNSSVRNVMSVSIILSSYGTEKNPNVGSFLGALFAFPCGIFHFAGFLNLRFVAIRWHWNCGSGFNLPPLIWGLPPNPRGDYTHHLYQCYLGHHHHVPFHYHSIVSFIIACHLLIPVPTLDRLVWPGLCFTSTAITVVHFCFCDRPSDRNYIIIIILTRGPGSASGEMSVLISFTIWSILGLCWVIFKICAKKAVCTIWSSFPAAKPYISLQKKRWIFIDLEEIIYKANNTITDGDISPWTIWRSPSI